MRIVAAIALLILVCAVVAFGFGLVAMALTDPNYSTTGIMDDPYPWASAIVVVKDHPVLFAIALFLVMCLAVWSALLALCPTVERP